LGVGGLRSAAEGRAKGVGQVQGGQRDSACPAVESHRRTASQRACVVVLDLRGGAANRASTLGCNHLNNASVVLVIQLAVRDVDGQLTVGQVCSKWNCR